MIESIDTYLNELRNYLIIEIVLVALFFVAMLAVWYMAIRKSEYSKGFLLLIVTICIFYVCTQYSYGLTDLFNKNIVIEENVKYERRLQDRKGKYATEGAGGHANIKFTIDGIEYGGMIIKGNADSWPRGERVGTIVYAPKSRLILDFIFCDEIESVISNDRLSELTGWRIPNSIEIGYVYADEYYGEEHSFCELEYPLFIKATIDESEFEEFLDYLKEFSMENSTDTYSVFDNIPEDPPSVEADYAFYHFNTIECMCENQEHNKTILTEVYVYEEGEQFVVYFQLIETDRRINHE